LRTFQSSLSPFNQVHGRGAWPAILQDENSDDKRAASAPANKHRPLLSPGFVWISPATIKKCVIAAP
jgi:hypothetical protein